MKDFDSLIQEKGLTIERLIALLRVANAHNLLDAAGGDRKRAMVISKMIHELSKFFGTELTERVDNTLRISPNGVPLVQIAEDFFARVLDFKRSLGDLPLQFSLGAGESILYSLVIPRLLQLHSNEQNITLDLHRRWDPSIIASLINHSLDFGIVAKEHLVPSLANEELGTTTYAMYAPTALLEKLGLSPSDPEEKLLSTLPFVSQHRGAFFQNRLVQRAAGANIRVNFKLYCDSAPAALLSMKAGGYAGFVHSLAAPALDMKVFTRIDLPMVTEVKPTLVLAWIPNRIRTRLPEAEAFKNHLIKTLRF